MGKETKQKVNGAVKTVSMVMIIMLIGKMTGLLRESIMSGMLGNESLESNAFNSAVTIPRDFLDFAFASAISSCFIPVFSSYLEKKGKKEAFKLANNFITIILILSTLITVLSMVFSSQLIAFMVPNLNAETQVLAAELLRIMLPTILISAIAFSITGVLQSLGEYNVPAAMSICSNVIIIIYLVFFLDKFGIHGLAFAFIIGWLTQFLIQVPSLIKKGYIYKPFLNLKDRGIKEIAVLVIPVMLSSWILPINNIVNKNSAAKLFGGSGRGATILDNANMLYSVITGILILSIANVIFPKLSKDIAKDDKHSFGETIKSTLRILSFLILPMTFGLMILGEPLISLVFERGKFGQDSTILAASALRYCCIGMLGFGVQTILSRGFYADRDTKTVFFSGLIAIAINAVLSATLVDYMGIGGPALASAVSITVTALIMLYSMYKKHPNILNKKMGFDMLKMLIVSITMAIVVYFVLLFTNNIITGQSFIIKTVKIIIPVVIGVIWYMILSYIVKIEEAEFVFSSINKFLRKGKEG